MMKNPFSRKKNSGEKGKEKRQGRFSDNVKDFFDPAPQKEKVLRHEDFRGAGDDYYATVSARYKITQRIFSVLFVVFLLFSILTNITNITYGNLFYFVRDFGNAVDIASTNYETVSYDVLRDQNFSLFRGGIAAVSPSNVSVYTATGRRTLRSRSSYVMPYAVSSKKYLLTYDLSGNTFALYNSFSKVYSEELDYPITDADISDSGVFAVVSRSSEFKTVINVYNNKIKLVGRYSKNQYCFDVAIDSEGERMAALFYEVGDGRGAATLRVYDISDKDYSKEDSELARILYEETLTNVFPLACSFFENGRLSFVTNSSVSIYDENYAIRDRIGFVGEMSAISADTDGTVLAIKNGALNGRNRIIAFNDEAELIFDDSVLFGVEGIGIRGEYVFIKSDSGAVRLSTANGDTEYHECHNGKMLVYDDSTVIVCGESSAVYIKFENN